MNPPKHKAQQLIDLYDFLSFEEAKKSAVILASETLKLALTDRGREYWIDVLKELKDYGSQTDSQRTLFDDL
jgi:hypothetical protein